MADEGLPPLPEPMEEERKMTKAEEAEAKKVRRLLVAFEIDDSLFLVHLICRVGELPLALHARH